MKRAEQELHKTIVRYLELSLPVGFLIDSKGALGDRSSTMGGIRKGMGAKAGMPDICIMGRLGEPPDDKPWMGWMEVKTRTGRVSPVQHAMFDRLRDVGWPVAVVRSLEDAESVAREWGLPMRARVQG